MTYAERNDGVGHARRTEKGPQHDRDHELQGEKTRATEREGDRDGVDTTNGWTAPLAPGLVNLCLADQSSR